MRLMLIILITLQSSACGAVTSRAWQGAEVLCEPHGGVKMVSLELISAKHRIYCNDGVQFKWSLLNANIKHNTKF